MVRVSDHNGHDQPHPRINERGLLQSPQREEATSSTVNNTRLIVLKTLFADIHNVPAGQHLGGPPVKLLSGREQRLKDIQDALAGKPIASERRPVKPLPGRERRLKEIQDALAGRPIASEIHSTQPTIECNLSVASPRVKPLTGRERRLKIIQDALEGISVASDPETRPQRQNVDSLPPDHPPMLVKPLTDRETRHKEIQDGTNSAPVSKPTNISTISVAKRSRLPESSPAAKRRRLEKSSKLTAKLSSSSILPAAVSTSTTTTPCSPTSSNASLQFEKPSKKARHQAAREPGQHSGESHIDTFFAQYWEFPYKPSRPMIPEFDRMCNFFGWEKSDPERVAARGLFQDAIAKEFNAIYGTDVHDIGSWRSLCRVLGIVPIPDVIEECRSVVAMTHVNIIDLVEMERNIGEPLQIFSSEEELSDYTKKLRKFYPRDNAYAGGLLRFLLRQIFDPSQSSRGDHRRGH